MSAAFRPAIRAIDLYGGSIQSFGGDALFAVFAGPSAVARALAAFAAGRPLVAGGCSEDGPQRP